MCYSYHDVTVAELFQALSQRIQDTPSHTHTPFTEAPQKGSSVLSSRPKFYHNPIILMVSFDILPYVYTFDPESRLHFALRSWQKSIGVPSLLV